MLKRFFFLLLCFSRWVKRNRALFQQRSFSIPFSYWEEENCTDAAIATMAHFHLKRKTAASQHRYLQLFILSKEMSICSLSGVQLFLLFLLFSTPLLSSFSHVDRGEIKATLLEESEYFRCGERAAFHTTCVAWETGPSSHSDSVSKAPGGLATKKKNQGHLSWREGALFQPPSLWCIFILQHLNRTKNKCV